MTQVPIGPNRVGGEVTVWRNAIRDLPTKVAAQRKVRKGGGARAVPA